MRFYACKYTNNSYYTNVFTYFFMPRKVSFFSRVNILLYSQNWKKIRQYFSSNLALHCPNCIFQPILPCERLHRFIFIEPLLQFFVIMGQKSVITFQ